jgi:hypothetical protein
MERIGIPPRSVGGDGGQASSRAGNLNREDLALSQIERNFGKGSIMRLSVDRICEDLICWCHNGPLSFQRYIRGFYSGHALQGVEMSACGSASLQKVQRTCANR